MQVMPFAAVPNYSVLVPIDNDQYRFDLRWNARAEAWYFDCFESDERTPIITGVKIVLGTYLGRRSPHRLFRTGVFVARDLSGQRQDAGFDDLGRRVVVVRYPQRDVQFIRLQNG